MKKVLLLMIILFLTGCEKNAVMICTSTTKDENHTNDYILNATFNDNKLEMMSLTGTSIYANDDSTSAAYAIVKEGYDQLSEDIDSSIETEVYYIKEKVYFKMRLYTGKLNDEGLAYLQNIFNIKKGYPTYNDFKAYIKANNYQCN
jgi:hypothetical protein